MFTQFTTRSSSPRGLLLGAMLGAGAWVAVCVSCVVDLAALPAALKSLDAPQVAPCSCPSKQALPSRPDAERAPRDVDPAQAPLPCRT